MFCSMFSIHQCMPYLPSLINTRVPQTCLIQCVRKSSPRFFFSLTYVPTNEPHPFRSEYDSFASTPWITALVSFVQTVLAHPRVKLIGVCFGHQIIARAMGAKVGRNVSKGWEVSVTDVDLTTQGQNYFFKKEGKDDDILVSKKKKSSLYSKTYRVFFFGEMASERNYCGWVYFF